MKQKRKGFTKRLLSVLIMGCLFAMLCSGCGDGDSKGYRTVSVVEVSGTVEVTKDGTTYSAYPGMLLQEGHEVTTGKNSYARAVLDGDKYVKLEAESRVVFETTGLFGSGKTRIRLERGSLTGEIVNPLGEEEEFTINTPNAVLAVRGTFFRVDLRTTEKGEIVTDVMTYGGTVASRRVFPDGTLSREEVLIPAGYKATICMTDEDTFYVLEGEDGELSLVTPNDTESQEALQKLTLIPIQIDEIPDGDLVDLYFAIKNGHDLFIPLEAIKAELEIRKKDIEQFTSVYEIVEKLLDTYGKPKKEEATESVHPEVTAKPTVTPRPTATATPIVTATPTLSPTAMPELTPTPSPTATPELTPTPFPTTTPVPTLTATPTLTPRPTAMPSPTPTLRPTPTPRPIVTPRPTATPSSTPTQSPTATQSPTPVPTLASTATPRPTATSTPTPTPTPVPTPMPGPRPTLTPRPRLTAPAMPTLMPTLSPTVAPTPGTAVTPTLRPTETPTPTPDLTATPTPAPHEHEEERVTVEATCTEAGYTIVKCKTCNEEISRTEIPALGHVKVSPSSTISSCRGCGEKWIELSYFEDAVFRTYIERYDTNGSGNLVGEEIQAVTVIDLSGSSEQDGGVVNLSYITNFPELTTLNCAYNDGLWSLDLSFNPKLTQVVLTGCDGLGTLMATNCTELEVLDVSECAGLTTISASGSGLRELLLPTENAPLDTLIVSDTNVEELDLQDCALLRIVDVGGCTSLRKLRVASSDLISLDVEGCTGMTGLYIQNARLTDYTEIGLDTATGLQDFEASNANLNDARAEEILSRLSGTVQNLNLGDNSSITALNVSDRTQLQRLILENCTGLITLDASGCTGLTELEVFGCDSLTTIDVSDCTGFTNMCFLCNPITVDASGCTGVTGVNFMHCSNLETLNLSGCTELTHLYMENCNRLVTLDVTGCTKLEVLEIPETNISDFSTMSLSNLVHFGASNANISQTDWEVIQPKLSDSLENLYLDGNTEITTVNLSGMTNLKKLGLGNCTSLNEINVTGCTKLEFISVNNTLLRTLDLSSVGTCLTRLNVSGCGVMEELDISNSNITDFTTVGLNGVPGLLKFTLDFAHLDNADMEAICSRLPESLEEFKICGNSEITSFTMCLPRLKMLNVYNCPNLSEIDLTGCSPDVRLTVSAWGVGVVEPKITKDDIIGWNDLWYFL